MAKSSAAKQLSFPAPRTWGGRRTGAGRKRSARPNVLHRTRPTHLSQHPAHVTLRRHADVPSLRNDRIFRAIRGAFRKASKSTFRVIHFSVQRDHIHMVVEAKDR